MLAIHAGLVAALTVLFLVLSFAWTTDANIGAGLVALPLLALGLPWSIPFLANPYRFDALSTVALHALIVGPALLNLAIHAAARAFASRRRRPSAAQPS